MNKVEINPKPKKPEHKIGNYYQADDSDVYILCPSSSSANEVMLISLSDGLMLGAPTSVADLHSVTSTEFNALCDGERLTRITSPITITPGE